MRPDTLGYAFAPGPRVAGDHGGRRQPSEAAPGPAVQVLSLRPPADTASFRAHSPVPPSLLAGIAPAPPAFTQRQLAQLFRPAASGLLRVGPSPEPTVAPGAAPTTAPSMSDPVIDALATLAAVAPHVGRPAGGAGTHRAAVAPWLRTYGAGSYSPFPMTGIEASVAPMQRPPSSVPLPRFTMAESFQPAAGGPVTA